MLKRTVLIMAAVWIMALSVSIVMVQAGSLEPPAKPAPTMKTLDQIPPTWSEKLPASERFALVLDKAAVLDKETGLVWEKSPSTLAYTWVSAIAHCASLEVGGRKGWHLPTIEQLASLVDKTQSNPSLPSGHPFSNVQSGGFYWSATTYTAPTYAGYVYFYNGNVNGFDKQTVSISAWCVRGGQSHDTY